MDLKVLPGLRYNWCGSGPAARLQIGGGWGWAWMGTSNATDNMNSVLTPLMRELSPSLFPLCECLSETVHRGTNHRNTGPGANAARQGASLHEQDFPNWA